MLFDRLSSHLLFLSTRLGSICPTDAGAGLMPIEWTNVLRSNDMSDVSDFLLGLWLTVSLACI